MTNHKLLKASPPLALVALGLSLALGAPPTTPPKTAEPIVDSNPFLGEIMIFGGNFAPRGWAKCEGQLLSISRYQALFSLLGTTFGGDGRSTFALPDLRGRSMVGNARKVTNRPAVLLGQRLGSDAAKDPNFKPGVPRPQPPPVPPSPLPDLAGPLKDLSSPAARVRDRAVKTLVAKGAVAVPFLIQAQLDGHRNRDRAAGRRGYFAASSALKTLAKSGVDLARAALDIPEPPKVPEFKPDPAKPNPTGGPAQGAYLPLTICIALNGTYPSRS